MNHESMVVPADAPDPQQVSDYLRSQGWRREPQVWRGSQVWSSPRGSGEQVLLPPRLEYRDDGELVLRALHTVARIEGREYRELLRAVKRPLVDTQYFHTHPISPSGTVPLLAGIETLEGIRSTFTLAAQSVLDPRPKLGGGRNIKAVDDFLRRVHLGPTSAGSYILSAEVPLTPQDESLLFTEPPKERTIVRAMKRSLSAAQKATKSAEAGNTMEPFDEAMSLGVSAKLCESIAKFGGQELNQKFSIHFRWSPAQPEKDSEESNRLDFNDRSAMILTEAGKHLRELEYSGIVRLTGNIIATERQSPQHDGFVKVRGTLRTEETTRERTLLVRLRGEAYTAALSAHARGESFTAEGRLTSSGNRRELSPSRVMIAGRDLTERD